MIGYLDDLNSISQLLNDGKTVLCPTDTIWGLSCDAFNEDATLNIFKIKNRDPNKKCILLVNSIDQLKLIVDSVHPRIETLIDLCKRPLTIIYKAHANLPGHLPANDGTIAVRVIRDHILSDLLDIFKKPLISTSANKQGQPFPENFSMIDTDIVNEVDYTFQEGRKFNGKTSPSVIIKYNEEGELFFLR